MIMATGDIRARPAAPSLGMAVIGFVEHDGQKHAGDSIQLPFAIPVIHVALGSGSRPNVAFSAGSGVAQSLPAAAHRPVFVIALSFAGAHRLFPDVMRVAVGQFVPVDDPFWSKMHADLSDAPTFSGRIEIAERHLRPRLISAEGRRSQLFRAADAVIQDRWTGPVSSLADTFGIEARTLRNRFGRELGWSPKRLLRVARFNRLLRTVHPRPWAGAPAWDVRLEFADDSHLYREFMHHAGFAPSAFTRAKRNSGDALLHTVTCESLDGPGRRRLR